MNDLFPIDEKWTYGKNKQWITRYEENSSNRIPVISGITVNNGINYYTEDIPNTNEVFSNCLTISTRGEYSGTVTYHDGKFVLANNILVMDMPVLTKNQKLFIGSVINGLRYGGYSNYPRIETLKKDKILLPIKNNEIDYDFMESFVADLNAQHVADLNAYLNVTGLNDYKLTEEEINILDEYKDITFEDYNIMNIFNVKNTKNILSRDIVENSGIDPYLCASSENNSISTYITYKEELKDEGNCVFIGGKTFVVTYQEKDFYSNDSHNLGLYLKDENFRNKYIQLYLVTCVKKSLGYQYSWGNSISKAKIKNDNISLPTINSKISYEKMEKFIKAIQKLVIKDVVKYADEKIKITMDIIA